MEREGGHHKVKGALGKREKLLIRRHRQAPAACRHGRCQIGRDNEGNAPRGEFGRHKAAPAEIKRAGEAARGVIQPVEQPIGGFLQNWRHLIHARSRPRTAARDKGPVKDAHLVGHGALGCTLFPKGARRVRVFPEIASGGKNHERHRCEGRPRRRCCFHH